MDKEIPNIMVSYINQATPRRENLDAWKKAREIVNNIYKATTEQKYSKDYGLKDQIRRAAISIMSNISEGFGRETDKEFTRYLYIAKASAAEVQSQLYISLDQKYINQKEFDKIYDSLDHCSRMIANFIKYLKTDA